MRKFSILLIALLLMGQTCSGQLTSQKINSKGNFNGLVILAEFLDTPFTISNPVFYFEEMLNTKGFDYQGAKGSVRDYFIANSDSLFFPEFKVVGPVKLSGPMSYYGENGPNGEEVHAAEMVMEACRLACAQINFADYDSNQDGMVDLVYVFFASYSENENQGCKEYIWSHAGNISDSCFIVNGKMIGRYACSSEYIGRDMDTSKQMATIGTFCHEFSHVLGLPDFYNTLSSSGLTLGSMSIMDKGNYLDSGRCPAGYSAFEKEYVGWLDVPVFVESDSVVLHPLNRRIDDSLKLRAFKIAVPGALEYYYFENRQQQGWDAFLPATGLFIYHVDLTHEDVWDKNEVNTDYLHPNYLMIRSGGKYADYEDVPFPGGKNVTSFTTPLLWSGGVSGFKLYDIKEQGNDLKFRVVL